MFSLFFQNFYSYLKFVNNVISIEFSTFCFLISVLWKYGLEIKVTSVLLCNLSRVSSCRILLTVFCNILTIFSYISIQS